MSCYDTIFILLCMTKSLGDIATIYQSLWIPLMHTFVMRIGKEIVCVADVVLCSDGC